MIFATFNTNQLRDVEGTNQEQIRICTEPIHDHIISSRAQAVIGMQLMAIRPPRDRSTVSAQNGRGGNWLNVPHSLSGASQVTDVDPLNEEVRLRLKID
jgi:hypothetical protein